MMNKPPPFKGLNIRIPISNCGNNRKKCVRSIMFIIFPLSFCGSLAKVSACVWLWAVGSLRDTLQVQDRPKSVVGDTAGMYVGMQVGMYVCRYVCRYVGM